MIDQSILVIYQHRQLGWRFNLYLADLLPDGTIRISGSPDPAFLNRKDFTTAEKQLLQTLKDTSDKSLMLKYSKDKTVVDFFKNLTAEKINNYIRPAIEIYAAQIVELAKKTGISVYLREEMKRTVLYPEQKIDILSEKPQCIFNFEKNDSGLRYFITLLNENSEISLKDKPDIVIANKPAMIISDNHLLVVEDIEAKRLTPFFTKDFISVPPSMVQKYMQDFVLKTFLQYQTKMKGIETVKIRLEKKAVLSLEEDFNRRLNLLLTFFYGERSFSPSSQRNTVAWLDEKDISRINWYDRDPEWENEFAGRLKSSGLRLEGENRWYEPLQPSNSPLGLIEWINSHQDILDRFEFRQQTDTIYYTKDISLRSCVSDKIDWFEIEMEVVAGDYIIPFTRFRKHILTGSREYVLPDGSVLVLPEEWFQKYLDIFLYGEKEGKIIRLKKIHFSLMESLSEDKTDKKKKEELLPEWKRKPSSNLLPNALNKILRPYQKEGFSWLLYLYRNNFGGCLADDMGLGKTLQTIALLQYIYAGSGEKKTDRTPHGQLSLFEETEQKIPATLIVVPTSLLHNWKNELKRFAPGLKTYLHAGYGRLKTNDIGKIFRHYHIVITSYGTLRNDIDYLSLYCFHYLILDESQYIKNADSQIYKAVKEVHALHHLVLTGTPVENSLSDLWAQFNFINEGLLGNYSSFRKIYIQPILKNDNKKAEVALQRLIRPFLLRRTKEEVTPELPPLMQEIVYCDMTDDQQSVYTKEKNFLRNSFFESSESIEKNKFIALQGLMRLRLLANHPLLGYPEYPGDSGKFEQILLSFESLKSSGHKVLIFSSFVKHLKLLAKAFDKQEWKYAMLTGQTTNREQEIRKFTGNDEVNCFFISLKAGGTGLNLTAADYVFIIDPWWNPAAEMQALSRAHRIGQDKNVMVYRFISSETIEEKILRLQEKKSELSSTFITSGNILDHLTEEEIHNLMS